MIITIISTPYLSEWGFDARGKVEHTVVSTAINPVMQWLFNEKPIPAHNNQISEK